MDNQIEVYYLQYKYVKMSLSPNNYQNGAAGCSHITSPSKQQRRSHAIHVATVV